MGRIAFLMTMIMISFEYGLSIVLYAKECPSENEWQFRAKQLECENQTGETYHCILDVNGQHLELCLNRKRFHSNGGRCPWVFISGEHSILYGEPLTECKVSGCPSSTISQYFYSDELYKYPKCLEPLSSRVKKSTVEVFTTSTRRPTTMVTTKDFTTSDSLEYTTNKEETNPLLAPFIIFIILLVVSIITNIWFFFRMSKSERRKKGDLPVEAKLFERQDSRTSTQG